MKQVVGARIPHKEVWTKFKQKVYERYGRIHGVLGIELEKALLAYLEEKQTNHEHTHTKKTRKREKLEKVKNKIKDAGMIYAAALQKIIASELQVYDQRTIKNYIFALQTEGFLMPASDNEKAYLINPNGW